jgi:predicted aconitase with swiveling domain
MESITLKGRSASKGKAEGEAMVTRDAISFLSDISVTEGIITSPQSEFKGQSVSDKILVFPTGRGSTADPYGFYMLKKAGKAPKAVINIDANPTTVAGAIISNTPMVYKLDKNPLDAIETGDHVLVDGNEGTVIITKKGRANVGRAS